MYPTHPGQGLGVDMGLRRDASRHRFHGLSAGAFDQGGDHDVDASRR